MFAIWETSRPVNHPRLCGPLVSEPHKLHSLRSSHITSLLNTPIAVLISLPSPRQAAPGPPGTAISGICTANSWFLFWSHWHILFLPTFLLLCSSKATSVKLSSTVLLAQSPSAGFLSVDRACPGLSPLHPLRLSAHTSPGNLRQALGVKYRLPWVTSWTKHLRPQLWLCPELWMTVSLCSQLCNRHFRVVRTRIWTQVWQRLGHFIPLASYFTVSTLFPMGYLKSYFRYKGFVLSSHEKELEKKNIFIM